MGKEKNPNWNENKERCYALLNGHGILLKLTKSHTCQIFELSNFNTFLKII
jgi:hypothetical protein